VIGQNFASSYYVIDKCIDECFESCFLLSQYKSVLIAWFYVGTHGNAVPVFMN